MSDLLTHWAVFDDCCRLIRFDNGVEPIFKQVLQEHGHTDFVRLGAIVRGPWRPPTMTRIRTLWGQPELHPELDRKLAFCLAGYTHVACDRVMKPLRQQLVMADEASDNPSTENVARQVYAYQDALVFQHVYGDGRSEPFNRFMMSRNNTPPGQALEHIVQAIFVNNLLSARTMVSDEEQLDRSFLEPLSNTAVKRLQRGEDPMKIVGTTGMSRRSIYEWLLEVRLQAQDTNDSSNTSTINTNWDFVKQLMMPDTSDPVHALDNLIQGIQWLYVDFNRLVNAYWQPDPEILERFQLDTIFYRPEDPVIAVARAIQRGEQVSVEEGRKAIALGANQSSYGHALELGLEYLRRVGAWWRGETDHIDAPNYKPEEYLRWNAERNKRAALYENYE